MTWMAMQTRKKGEIQARNLSVMSAVEKNLDSRDQKDFGATT